jgi:hypothetical protein
MYDKAVVYSIELQKLFCGYRPSMIMVRITMYDQAVLPQYVPFVFVPVMVFLHVQFCVTHALCQSAVSITNLYMSCCPVPPAPYLAVLSLQHHVLLSCPSSTISCCPVPPAPYLAVLSLQHHILLSCPSTPQLYPVHYSAQYKTYIR